MVEYTEKEIAQMKQILSVINNTGNIPNNHQGLIWNRYKQITGSKEKQPCSCPSAAKHWYKATMAIAKYLDKLEGNEIV